MSVIVIQICRHIPSISHNYQCLSLYSKDECINKHSWYFIHIGRTVYPVSFLFLALMFCPWAQRQILYSSSCFLRPRYITINHINHRLWQIKHFQVPLVFGTRSKGMCGRHYLMTTRQICSVLVQQTNKTMLTNLYSLSIWRDIKKSFLFWNCPNHSTCVAHLI